MSFKIRTESEIFADNLKNLLEKNGLRNIDLANMLHLSKAAISNYLAGNSVPCKEVLQDIANLFHVSTDSLIPPVPQSFRLNSDNKPPSYEVPVFVERLMVENSILYTAPNYVGACTFPYPPNDEYDCYAVFLIDDSMASYHLHKFSYVYYAATMPYKDGDIVAVFINDRIRIRKISEDGANFKLICDEGTTLIPKKIDRKEFRVLGKVIMATMKINEE